MSMTVEKRGYADHAYLAKVTEAMTAFRQDDRYAGLYDVGDLNWWWRDGNFSEPDHQMFWVDEKETILAFGLLSADYRAFDYEFLPRLGDRHEVVLEMFEWGLEGLKEIAGEGARSVFMRDSHAALRTLAERAGFTLNGEAIVQTTLELPSAHTSFNPPEGYWVRSLEEGDLRDGGTPVLHQNADALKRVRETPLYRHDLHLVVEAPGGRLAAECIVWLDTVNKIGIFEPVRTHPDFYRQGLGKVLLSEGLKRMSERGATLAKVGYERGNEAAKRLYETLGFQKAFEKLEHVRVSS